MSSSSSSSPSDVSSLLHTVHQSQLLKYLKYFRRVISDENKEIKSLFSEQIDVRLLDDMYSQKEVEDMMRAIESIVAQNVTDGLTKFTNQLLLFLQQLFLQAEGNEILLQIDLNDLDSQLLMKGIEKLKSDLEKVENDMAKASKKELSAISGAADAKLVTKIKHLEQKSKNEIEGSKQFYENQIAKLKEENENLKEKLQNSEREKELMAGGGEGKEDLINEINSLKLKLKSAQKDFDEKMNGRLSESKQFQELKKILLTRNQQIKDMREKIKQ